MSWMTRGAAGRRGRSAGGLGITAVLTSSSRKTSSMRWWRSCIRTRPSPRSTVEVADHVVGRASSRDLDLDQPVLGRAGRAARRRRAPGRAAGRRRRRPCTSTSRMPVACRKSVVAEERSSRPPSSTTTWSLTRSSSPSRCEVTSTAMPKSCADPAHQRRACRRGRPGRGRWSARRAAPAAGRGRAPGRAWPAASCRWSSRPSAGSAPRPGRRGAARRRRARGPRRSGSPDICAMCTTKSLAEHVGGQAVVLGHVADQRPDLRRPRWPRRGRARCARPAGRGQQARAGS